MLVISTNICAQSNEITHTQDVIPAIMQFSFNIIHHEMADGKNIVLSPFLMHNTLTLLANGSNGKTLQELEDVLGTNKSILTDYYKNINIWNESLRGCNSFWFEENIKVNQQFSDICHNFAETEIKHVDFSQKTIEDSINIWIERKTNYAIKNMILGINPTNKLVIANTIYFLSNWYYPFPKEKNVTNSFFLSNKKKEKTIYMNNCDNYQYFQDKHAQGLILPYEDTDFSFLAILPNKNITVSDYITSLNSLDLLNNVNNAKYEMVDLYLPKFKIMSKLSLDNTFKKMGIIEAFNPVHADFSGMAEISDSLYLEIILQNTFIHVLEDGTEASSAVVTFLDGHRASEKIKPKKIEFNRPFVFCIIENNSKTPLFIGIMENPLDE